MSQSPLAGAMQSLPASPSSPLLHREAVAAAQAWLSRFSPLLDDPESLEAPKLRERLAALRELADTQAEMQSNLAAQATASDATLLATVRGSAASMTQVESDLRRRLAALSPGDPQGEVDLDSLQRRLANTAARHEVEAVTERATALGDVLDIKTGGGNIALAVFPAIFGLGWLSFTTVHAVLMIGGFSRVAGWAAVFLLGFYAIFWGVGFAILYGAWQALLSERLVIDGRRISLIQWCGPIIRRQEYLLSGRSKAVIRTVTSRSSGSAVTGSYLAIDDKDGKEIKLIRVMDPGRQELLAEEINRYLAAQ